MTVAEANDCVPNMLRVLNAARKAASRFLCVASSMSSGRLRDLEVHCDLIVMGLIAHMCVEAKVRYAAELGYEVTMVKDATAGYSDAEMHAAVDMNIPNYANVIVTTNEVVETISSLSSLRISA